MPKKERMRQPIMGSFKPEEVQAWREQGWTLVALEWEREVSEEEAME